MKKKTSFIPLLFSLGFSSLFLSSCSNDKIIFANYQSYMSVEIQNQFEKKYNTKFLSYGTNEEIESKFKNFYDIAIPSVYEQIELIKKGYLLKLDWNVFDITVNGTKITNGLQARDTDGLFTNSIRTAITLTDKNYQQEGIISSSESILDYGIPYFLQKFIFAYKGSEIPSLSQTKSWEEILNDINSNNPIDDRFKPNKERKIGVIDDVRSVYGLSNLIFTNNQSVNPSDKITSINDFENVYKTFSDNFYKGYTYFNSDSNQIITGLANHYPNGLSSAIAYNGDVLYAATGGGIYDEVDPNNFHITNLDKSLIALDMVVINKKNQNQTNKLNQIYQMIRELVLSGTSDNDGEIYSLDESGNYIYNSMNNFDFVNYTSPLYKINEYVENGNYFSYSNQQLNQLCKKIYQINIDENSFNLFEKNISDLSKSNMQYAYYRIKQNL